MKEDKLDVLEIVEGSLSNPVALAADGGAVSRVQGYTNYNAETTYTANCTIRSGYATLSGTLGAYGWTSVNLWNIPIDKTLGCTASLSLANNSSVAWDGKTVIVNVGRDYDNNCYRLLIYNSHVGNSVNLTGVRIEYTAILKP